MTKSEQGRFQAAAAMSTLVGILAGCGGGGGSEPPGPAPTITGFAGTGAALANSPITAKCVAGAPVSGTTNADGTFALPLDSGQTAPCIVRVEAGALALHSFASAPQYVNVTPMTDLVVTHALGSDPSAAFDVFDAGIASQITNRLGAAKSYVAAEVAALTLRSPTADPLTGALKVGDPDDRLLDAIGTALRAAGKSVGDLRVSAAIGGTFQAAMERGTLADPATPVATLTMAQIDAGTAASGLQPLTGLAKCDVAVIALNYRTLGVKGEPTNASGAVLLPAGACTDATALVAYAKGTDVTKPRTLANPADAETFLLIATYAAQGYAVVATDYLGYARSAYAFHPYLHADSEATSVIDSIRAAREAAALAGTVLTGRVMLVGYSQGGHASMAAHRAIERNDAPDIGLVAGAHLAGPYNLSGAVRLKEAVAGYQFFVPFLVTAWQKVYGNLYADVGSVFKSPYASTIENLLPSATLDYATLISTGALPGMNGETPNQARDLLFQPAFLADVQANDSSPVYVAARKNDLLGWSPKRSAVLLCGGAGDPTVPPAVHQQVMKADFDSRGLGNVLSVDVDAMVQATFGVLASPGATAKTAPTDPTTPEYAIYYGNYHGTYEPPFCHAYAKALFDAVRVPQGVPM